jgi:hypothetical protein
VSELLSTVTLVEKEFSLLDNIVNYLILADHEGKYLLSFKFGDPQDYNLSLIGGLVATINEFAGDFILDVSRSIKLKELKLIFRKTPEFAFIVVCDPEYPDQQFDNVITFFMDSFNHAMQYQEYGVGPDGASVCFQIISDLISEEIGIELDLSDKIGIFPYKLKQIAADTVELLFEKQMLENIEAEDHSITFDSGETIGEIKIVQEDARSEILDATRALHQFLFKFTENFPDISSITLLRVSEAGEVQHITKGKLESEIKKKVLETIYKSFDIVATLIEQTDEHRTIDLEGRFIYFQQVSLTSFVYIILETLDNINTIKPLVNNISDNLATLFPDEF